MLFHRRFDARERLAVDVLTKKWQSSTDLLSFLRSKRSPEFANAIRRRVEADPRATNDGAKVELIQRIASQSFIF
jgi:hypothetical protein